MIVPGWGELVLPEKSVAEIFNLCMCPSAFLSWGKRQDVYFPPPHLENHDMDVIKSLHKAENSNHTY